MPVGLAAARGGCGEMDWFPRSYYFSFSLWSFKRPHDLMTKHYLGAATATKSKEVVYGKDMAPKVMMEAGRKDGQWWLPASAEKYPVFSCTAICMKKLWPGHAGTLVPGLPASYL